MSTAIPSRPRALFRCVFLVDWRVVPRCCARAARHPAGAWQASRSHAYAPRRPCPCRIQLDAEAEREASLVAKAQAALFLDSPGSRSRPGSAALRPAPVRRAAAPSAPSAPQAPVAPS